MCYSLSSLDEEEEDEDQEEEEEEEEEGSFDTDEGQDYRVHPSRDTSSLTGPSPSSVVKLEANQKARNKKQRQELYGEAML